MVEIIPYKNYENYKGRKIISKDACKKKTIAVFTNGATMIPLCEDCLVKLQKEIRKIN